MADILDKKLRFSEPALVAAVLGRIQPLPPDHYFTAYGPNGQYLFATPKGHAGLNLPGEIVEHLDAVYILGLDHASMGIRHDAWFISYWAIDGRFVFELGNGAPESLKMFVNMICPPHVRGFSPFLRVQFGGNGGWVAWNHTSWACKALPGNLLQELFKASHLVHQISNLQGAGVLRMQIRSITWSREGSYYAKFIDSNNIFKHVWEFKTDVLENAWKRLWQIQGSEDPTIEALDKLAHVAISPFSYDGDTFLFIKKTGEGALGPDFITRFAPLDIVARLSPTSVHTKTSGDQQVQSISHPGELRRVRARITGRPHSNDFWELFLKAGEVLFLVKDMGNGWVQVKNQQGQTGYAHKSSIDFEHGMHGKDIYPLFKEAVGKILHAAGLQKFPDFTGFNTTCPDSACQSALNDPDSIGMCPHGLEKILRGSGCYSSKFLREERKMWHPDSFARLCDPAHREELKVKAQRMFVVFGQLIDVLEEGVE